VSKPIGFVPSQEIMAGLLLSYDIHYIPDITDTMCITNSLEGCSRLELDLYLLLEGLRRFGMVWGLANDLERL
jgi:hypothetical protein